MEIDWEKLSPEEKKIQLYLKQKKLLDDFLERGAISRAQYEKSLRDLTDKFLAQEREQSEARLVARTYAEQKMGMQAYGRNEN